MTPKKLTPELLDLIAERFKVLSEPTRLMILSELRSGEHSVSDLVDRTGLAQANVSKHLRVLHHAGFVTRRKEGLFTYYDLSGQEAFQLCDILCGRLEQEMRDREEILSGAS